MSGGTDGDSFKGSGCNSPSVSVELPEDESSSSHESATSSFFDFCLCLLDFPCLSVEGWVFGGFSDESLRLVRICNKFLIPDECT